MRSSTRGASVLRQVTLGTGLGLLACGTQLAVSLVLEVPTSFLLFFPAVFASTWLGSRIAGYVTLAISTSGGWAILTWGAYPTPVVKVVLALAVFVATASMVLDLTARLRLALAARNALVSIAGHDLKSPLATIQLTAQAIEHAATELDAARVRSKAATICRQVDRLLFMINNLLDVSRVHADGLRLAREEVDLTEVVRSVLDRFRGDFESAGYEVSVRCDGDTVGCWDRMSVEQITVNLVNNAIKYGEHKPLDIEVVGADKAVCLVVKDRGRGMTRDEQLRVFRPFERAGPAQERRETDGHGLGLWIVDRLVDAHGGRILLESEHRAGTTVRVELPRSLQHCAS